MAGRRDGALDLLLPEDVELTRQLALYGQEHGPLLFERKDQGRLRVPVDWSWPSLRKRFARG